MNHREGETIHLDVTHTQTHKDLMQRKSFDHFFVINKGRLRDEKAI